HLEQPLVGLGDETGAEIEDADGLPLRQDREKERVLPPRAAHDVLAQHTRLVREIGDPERLRRLPHGADEPAAGLERDSLALLDDGADGGVRDTPRRVHTKHAVPLVEPPVHAAIPVLRKADRTHRGGQRLVGVAGIGEDARDRAAQGQETTIALLVSDVAREPAVAEEASLRIEYRPSADADEAVLAGLVGAPHDEVGEGLPRTEQAPVSVPPVLVERKNRELPRRLAEHALVGGGRIGSRAPDGEAVVFVDLPLAIARQPDAAVEPALALRERLAQPFDFFRRRPGRDGRVGTHGRPPSPAANRTTRDERRP